VRSVYLAAALVVAGLAGCSGPDRSPITGATVTGVVRHKGALVTGGTVRLIAVDDPNKSMSGQIDGNGQYRVPNAPVGVVMVVVETESAKHDLRKLLKNAPEGTTNLPDGPPLKYVKMDAKYQDPAKTDVKLTVETGEQEKDIDLP
jgi:hypothetical protein